MTPRRGTKIHVLQGIAKRNNKANQWFLNTSRRTQLACSFSTGKTVRVKWTAKPSSLGRPTEGRIADGNTGGKPWDPLNPVSAVGLADRLWLWHHQEGDLKECVQMGSAAGSHHSAILSNLWRPQDSSKNCYHGNFSL